MFRYSVPYSGQDATVKENVRRLGRPREHDEATAKVLLDAAEQLLAELGPDGVSVRAVARVAETSTRAVYSLFDSKAGLIDALATRGYTDLTQRVKGLAATDDPAADLVAVGVHAFRPFVRERPHLFRLTFERVTSQVVADPAAATAAYDSYLSLVQWIRHAQHAGVIDDRPEQEVAFAYHALCQGLAGGELSREPPPVGASFWGAVGDIEGERLWAGALTALVAGLAPRT